LDKNEKNRKSRETNRGFFVLLVKYEVKSEEVHNSIGQFEFLKKKFWRQYETQKFNNRSANTYRDGNQS